MDSGKLTPFLLLLLYVGEVSGMSTNCNRKIPPYYPYFTITQIGRFFHDKWPGDSLQNSQCKLRGATFETIDSNKST